MLLTISTTHRPATDLGYLLHKNPLRTQSFSLAFGKAHVFYLEVGDERCTAALLLDIDPVGLVRGPKTGGGEGALEAYVNDRPYVASSFFSVALGRVFRDAMAGRSKERQSVAGSAIPITVELPAVPCRGGEPLLRKLFEPLGYTLTAAQQPLDPEFEAWGSSRYFRVKLEATRPLSEFLTHLYVLMPVLDDDKHYFVGDDEVEKLLRHGEGWLASHPERESIAHRYLKHRRSLARQALERLVIEEEPHQSEHEDAVAAEEEKLEAKVSLNEQRLDAVMGVVRELSSTRVLDLGCGDGKLLRALMREKTVREIVGMDVSVRALEIARDRLDFDRLPEKQRERIRLLHGSLMYRDKRLEGFELATVIEVVEHLDEPRLRAFERVLFEFARPMAVVLTTPNVEFNVKFESLPAGHLRHKDHRFEWTRAEFELWARKTAERFGYCVRFAAVGPLDATFGAPTQMAVFSR
jgi:3' terminal RNA ribose 2'-O-methyltransferase Hen1